jgi:hypothetical protein
MDSSDNSSCAHDFPDNVLETGETMPREKKWIARSHGPANVSDGTMFPLETRGSIRNSILERRCLDLCLAPHTPPCTNIDPAPFRPSKTHGTLLIRDPGNALSLRDIHCRAALRVRVAIERSLQRAL